MPDITHATILALPNSLATSVSLPLEMLNAAEEACRSRRQSGQTLSIDVASLSAGPVITAGGMQLLATRSIADIDQTQLVILPSLWRKPMLSIKRFKAIIPWLQAMHVQGAIICAVGTSSCFLAEAGLLTGKPATTHWYYCDNFRKHYPEVDLKQEYLITEADNIYCAASVNSVADLMIHLISRLYGRDISQQVEGQFSPEIRRPFEDHAYSQSNTGIHQDEVIVEAQDWLRQHYAEDVRLSELAALMDVSTRTFNRRFKQAAGITASEYLLQQRVNSGKDLLRTTNLSIQEVAARSGFHDSSYFCARFKDSLGQTPLSYRRAVRGKLFKVI